MIFSQDCAICLNQFNSIQHLLFNNGLSWGLKQMTVKTTTPRLIQVRCRELWEIERWVHGREKKERWIEYRMCVSPNGDMKQPPSPALSSLSSLNDIKAVWDWGKSFQNEYAGMPRILNQSINSSHHEYVGKTSRIQPSSLQCEHIVNIMSTLAWPRVPS